MNTNEKGFNTSSTARHISVFGVTNREDAIARLLGLKDESEYAFYQETRMGRYYGPILPNGSIDTTRLIRLISDEQAEKLESDLCATIADATEHVAPLIASVPKIDLESFEAAVAKPRDTLNAQIADVSQQIRQTNENLANVPTFSSTANVGRLSPTALEQLQKVKQVLAQIQQDLDTLPRFDPDSVKGPHIPSDFGANLKKTLDRIKAARADADEAMAQLGIITGTQNEGSHSPENFLRRPGKNDLL